MANLSRHYPIAAPNGVLTVFSYTGEAVDNLQFQQFYAGQLLNEIDDYTIVIGGGLTTVTLVRIVPAADEEVIAYF